MLRRINLSAALIVLVCFFLPWVQVSCAGANDTLSGVDLARHEETILWVVPLLMCAVLVSGLVRVRSERTHVFCILSAVSGAIVPLLMNRERDRVEGESGIIATHLTGWFWLGFIAAGAVVVTAVAMMRWRRKALSG